MESDRLLQPVFREFYSERDVVQEERRLRVDSTPTGTFDEQFDAHVLEVAPVQWAGRSAGRRDLKMLSLADAEDYFSTYYAPNNLTAALVGNFDPAEVKRARREVLRPHPARREAGARRGHARDAAARREADERRVRLPAAGLAAYHTVPFEHRDCYALRGARRAAQRRDRAALQEPGARTQIAASASASQQSLEVRRLLRPLRRDQGRRARRPISRRRSYAELERLQNEPVPAEELQKVKNQIAADAFRRLENPFFLMLQLLFYEGWATGRYLNTWADRTLAVTAEDVQRVAGNVLRAREPHGRHLPAQGRGRRPSRCRRSSPACRRRCSSRSWLRSARSARARTPPASRRRSSRCRPRRPRCRRSSRRSSRFSSVEIRSRLEALAAAQEGTK